MGIVFGPFEEDDAIIGDVPDLIETGLIAEAFRPAYIELVPDTQHDNGDVVFDYHLWNWLLDHDYLDQLQEQGEFGRNSVSETGKWWVYVQSAYEGPEDFDFDPNVDIEGPAFGATWNDRSGQNPSYGFGKWSFVFTEAIRDSIAYWSQYSGQDEAYVRQWVTLHEIAHTWGMPRDSQVPDVLDDPIEVGGLLVVPVPYFTPAQLKQLRCGEGQPTCQPPSRRP
jgi:hypothetical protein